MPDRQAPAAPAAALDARQAEAVAAPPGPLLVLAGAGSGKTRVLTERAAALVARHGQPAEALLVITFTNRAADELRSRLESLVGEAAARMTIGTFHAVCHRMLRAHAPRAGRSSRFSVYDAQASRRLIASVLAELGADEELPAKLVALQIGQAKARLLGPADYRALLDNERTARVAAAFARYERALERSDALDFDDLISRSVALLGDADLAARYRRRWRAILVDEHQDTNPAQHELVRRLAAGHRNVTVAGDDDQAIYRFRGAEVGSLLGFERDFPEARVVALERNYRSTGAIVAAAARLAAHNPERRGEPRPCGPPRRPGPTSRSTRARTSATRRPPRPSGARQGSSTAWRPASWRCSCAPGPSSGRSRTRCSWPASPVASSAGRGCGRRPPCATWSPTSPCSSTRATKSPWRARSAPAPASGRSPSHVCWRPVATTAVTSLTPAQRQWASPACAAASGWRWRPSGAA
jgi:superfamily I DNA/RNA helicase